jgi:peptidyl-prolyl cis-trans isomerase C
MKLVRWAALAALLAAAPAWAQNPRPAQTPAPAAPAAAQDPVLARVDGAVIRRSDVVNFQRNLPPQFQQMPIEALIEPIMDRLISQKLLAADGRKQNLQNDAELRRRMAQFEERLLQETLLGKILERQVTEAALRQRYEAYAKENPGKEEVRARHILVGSEAQAQAVLRELRGGADFAKLATDRSIDPAGKQSGGDLGYFAKDEMVPEFAEAAFAMKPGDVSTAPVRTQFGWHVIRVEDRRSVSESFEEVRERLTSELSQEIMQGYVENLRKSARIELVGLDGRPLPPASPAPAPAR